MKAFFLIILLSILEFYSCSKANLNDNNSRLMPQSNDKLETATFAGGCFWCMDAPFENIDGVKNVISGFAGGHEKNPSYEEVSTGTTGAVEAIQVVYDPSVISYPELLDVYWKQFDPTDAGGSFFDRGSQYESVVFYKDSTQKKLAEESKVRLDRSGIFKKPIVTKIEKFTAFYPAEDYHQHFYKKNPVRFNSYEKASGRENFIIGVWGDSNISKYKKLPENELKKKLTPLQYDVTQNGATEKPFQNEYWDNHKEGIYVDIVSGEPLFSSKDKFDSGTGWPSFTQPIDPRFLIKKEDNSLGTKRIEVQSKIGNTHLGHLFDDGPAPTNLRYCLNSAALRFIPKDEMEKEGYGEFLWLFK